MASFVIQPETFCDGYPSAIQSCFSRWKQIQPARAEQKKKEEINNFRGRTLCRTSSPCSCSMSAPRMRIFLRDRSPEVGCLSLELGQLSGNTYPSFPSGSTPVRAPWRVAEELDRLVIRPLNDRGSSYKINRSFICPNNRTQSHLLFVGSIICLPARAQRWQLPRLLCHSILVLTHNIANLASINNFFFSFYLVQSLLPKF